MHSLFTVSLFLATCLQPLAAPVDGNCEMAWVTVYGDAPSTTNPSVAASAVAAASTATAKGLATVQTESSASMSGQYQSDKSASGSTSANNRGEPGFPLDGPHLTAPVSNVPVPAGAATFKPSSSTFSGKEFGTWLDQQKNAKLASKWLVIAPGVYDLSVEDGLVIGFTPGGWTLDFRGVTFKVKVPVPNNTSGQAIYINQSEELTILGGTIWFDKGEQFSQAKITTISAPDSSGKTKATLVVDEGYDLDVWKTAGPRNVWTRDTSNPDHYPMTGSNLWFVLDYNYDQLTSKRTMTLTVDSPAALKEGYYLVIAVPDADILTAIASEWNGGLKVDGLTTNGGLAQYGIQGLKNDPIKTPAKFNNIYIVNPPARPGFAPRVMGPTLSFGHIGYFNFDAEGDEPWTLTNSFWQTSGSVGDLQDMNKPDNP